MIFVVLTIGLVNLCFGFALAIYVDHALTIRARLSEGIAIPVAHEQDRAASLPSSETTKKKKSREELQVEEEIPEEWLDLLESESVEAQSFVEASVQVLRLEVGKYRAHLMTIEQRARELQAAPDESQLVTLLDELKQLNEEWLSKQSDAANALSGKGGSLGDFDAMANLLEEILLDQAAQIETTCSNLALLDFKTDITAGCSRLIGEICLLVDLAHQLLDGMMESMVLIMKADKKLDDVKPTLCEDGLCQVRNLTGLEVLFYQWWRDDVGRQRTVSVAFIDVDRFAKINEVHGTDVGDSLLAGFGPLLDELIRKDRGMNFVARLAGQTFMLFFGDTGPRAAMSGAERVRQTLEATTFTLGDVELNISASIGVTEVLKSDDTKTLFTRCKKTVREAQKAGRNRTYIDEGDGPNPIDPPEYKVKGRIIPLREV